MKLTIPSSLEQITKKAVSFNTNILVVGGAYAGLRTVLELTKRLHEQSEHPQFKKKLEVLYGVPYNKLSITLIEPRNGFLNIIGMPRSIIDPEFAKSQFIQFNQLKDIHFDKIVSNDDSSISQVSQQNGNSQNGFELTYVQGKVTSIDETTAQYQLNESDQTATIHFDQVILASGRDRKWPITPQAYNYRKFIEEMKEFLAHCGKHDIISVIGAGAVGLEVAADIKKLFPAKAVNLIHPHPNYPPEPLSIEFKNQIHQSLTKAGVNVITNTRVSHEKANGDLVTTTGETIKSRFNYWCNSHRNNTQILLDELQKKFVNHRNNLWVNDHLQLKNPQTNETLPNFYAAGDLAELPVIKSAGWANFMGTLASTNVISSLFEDKLVQSLPQDLLSKNHMIVIAGDEDVISEINGEVVLNLPYYVDQYKSYCMEKVLSIYT